MKSNITNSVGSFILSLAGILSGCKDNSTGTDPDPDPEVEIPEVYQNLPGTVTAEDQTWSNDTTLAGPHFVLPGITLTIEPGVTVSFEYHKGISDDVGTIITLMMQTISRTVPGQADGL